jgi:hypothetical protein
MSTGAILTVLANIPWGTVVDNAPKVAEGAEKLWKAVGRWGKTDPVQNGEIDAPPQAPMTEREVLAMRLKVLEESVRHLNEQMQASSELVKALADQNTLLVQRAEMNRLRLARLTIAAGGLATLLIGLTGYLLLTR